MQHKRLHGDAFCELMLSGSWFDKSTKRKGDLNEYAVFCNVTYQEYINEGEKVHFYFSTCYNLYFRFFLCVSAFLSFQNQPFMKDFRFTD